MLNINWVNKDNIDFYKAMSVKDLESYAIKAGLDDDCDLDKIYHYIQNTNSLLEIGAGYGRILKNLIERGYQGEISALERNEEYFKYLVKNFTNKAKMFYSDLYHFNPEKKVDAILLMWSTFSDFPQKEQPLIIAKLADWLNSNGLIIIDVIQHDTMHPIATQVHKRIYFATIGSANYHAFVPTPAEIKKYAKKCQMQTIDIINYTTYTGRKRVIFVLKKIK